MKNAWIDLETTGVNSNLHGIHQIAGIIEIDGEEKERFEFKVKPFPQDVIEDKALEVSGVSREIISEYPLTPKECYTKIVSLCSKYVSKYDKTDKFYFFGFNALFDYNMLREFFNKNGDTYFGSFFWFPPFDVMQFVNYKISVLDNARIKVPNMNLRKVAEYFGIDLSERKLHDAIDDILLTKEVFEKVKGEIKI